MRVDEMVVEVHELLPAAPEQAFALLTDVERMAGLGPEHVRARWQDERRGLGAVFVGSNVRGELQWDVPCVVVEHEPPVRFAWATGSAETPSATWSYELVPADGGTRVTQRFRLGPGTTSLRTVAAAHPQREAEYVARRGAELERNMRSVLRAAAALLA